MSYVLIIVQILISSMQNRRNDAKFHLIFKSRIQNHGNPEKGRNIYLANQHQLTVCNNSNTHFNVPNFGNEHSQELLNRKVKNTN
jgi:hypothetical protein